MTNDELQARRWFRRMLQELGERYPSLKNPDRQDACQRWLRKSEKERHDNGEHDTDKNESS